MDKSGVFVGATVGSISVFIIFSIIFIIPENTDETTIQIQNKLTKMNYKYKIKLMKLMILSQKNQKLCH